MASRSSDRGRTRSGRSRSSSSSSSNSMMPIMIGGGVVVVVVLILVMNSGGNGSASAAGSNTAKPPTAPPVAAAPAPAQLPKVAAKPGKTPTTPPPALTNQTLGELSALLDRVKALRNESVQARTGAGDNTTARAKMGEAKALLDEWNTKSKAASDWHMEAKFEDWALPSEYVQFESLYAVYSRLEKEVRLGGG